MRPGHGGQVRLYLGVALPLLALAVAPARAWDQWAHEVVDFSSQYSDTSYSAQQVLDLPNVINYGDHGAAWAPASKDGTTEYVTVRFIESVFADGVTIRESNANGFVRKVETLDTGGTYRQVWAGTDPSQTGQVVDFRVNFTRTAYLVRGVRITISTNHDPGDWEEIDAIRLHGQAQGDYQWASRVIDFSSEYNPSPENYSAARALGEPDVLEYGDDVNAWTPEVRGGTTEFLTLGFERPVFATGVLIRESSGTGFVRKIEALDTGGTYHEVWAGVDPSQPDALAMFLATWPQTAYAVDGIRITVNTAHSDNWEEIDAAYIRGASATTPAPTVTGINPGTSFREAPDFTLTVNGANFLGTSVVRWNGSDRPTQYVSPTQLKAEIKSSDIATPGTANVTVFTPPPGGGSSNALPFTVSTTYAQWASTVIAVSSEYNEPPYGNSSARALGAPDVTEYGDDANAWTTRLRDEGLQSLTLGFSRAVYANGALIRESNANGFVRKIETLDMAGVYHTVWSGTDNTAPGQLASFHVPFTQTTYAVRGLRITVDTNHALEDWEEIDAVQLEGIPVTNAVPAITSLGPNPALRAGPAFTLVVNGAGFAPNSVVRWNGADRPTTYVSPNRLTIPVPASDVAATGSASITVLTPAPGGGTSGAVTLAIGPARYGDVNGNNATAMDDVVAALRIAAGINAAASLNGGDVAPEYPGSAGGYGDGRIAVSDALRIARFLRGL